MQPQAIEKNAATPADAATVPKPGALTRMRRSPYFFPLIGLVAVSIVMALTTENFLSSDNFGASDFPVDGEHGNSRPDRSPFGFSGVRRRSFELACRVLIPQTSTALMRCRIALACNIRRY